MDFGLSRPQHRDFEVGLSGSRYEGGCRSLFRHYRLKTSNDQSPVIRSYVGLDAKRQRRDCVGAATDFVRAIPEPHRLEYGVRGSQLGNVESGMDS
jgi:hypothetical protein